MRVNGIIWILVAFWIFSYVVIALTTATAVYIFNRIALLFLSQKQINIFLIVCGVYGCWLVVNLGTALQAAKTSRKAVAVIFLCQSYFSLVFEIAILWVVFSYRDEYVETFIYHLTEKLVAAYNISIESKFVLDNLHELFECCGTTQWHYEWWMDDKFRQLPNSSYAWVPMSCCNRISQYNGCGIALPHSKPVLEKKPEDENTENESDDDTEEEEKYFQSGSMAAAEWYNRLHNEPCPELIIEFIGEWPTYCLMLVFSLCVGKTTISTAASMAIFSMIQQKPNT